MEHIPYKLTKVIFGRRAADSFYAIDVVIGNNTGFDLQLVGVGFDNTMGQLPAVGKNGLPLQPKLDKEGKPVLDEHGNKFVPALDKNGDFITVDGKPDGEKVYRPLITHQLPSSDHRLVRGSIEFQQLYGRRALGLKKGGFGFEIREH